MKILNLEIKGVTCNSKEVKPGYAFVAIKGSCQDGNRFIKEAVARGAGIIIVEKKIPKIKIIFAKTKLVAVDDCRKFLAQAALKFYGSPADKIKVIGITGTNGKTTVSYLIEAIAKECGHPCGVIGTINYRFKGKVIAAKNTTPGPEQLQKLLAQMYARGVKYCAMEVSSHALDQDRVAGINFSQAVFTNLTQDHLDYHKNFENYFSAKAKLFSGLPEKSCAIINADDQYACRIKQLTKARIITYGVEKEAMVIAKNINFGMQSTEFSLATPKINLKVKTHLVGRHNIYNILAAVCWGLSENLPTAKIKSAIEKFKNVPGRLEKINCKKGFNIFVDYAHTPDALFNVIRSLRQLVEGKIMVIFGCGGERDKLKRPQMGKIVNDLADYAIITSDNPRSENPDQIIKDIQKGMEKNNYLIIPQRLAAIRKGLSLANKGDCLLIAGKGHEDYQILKNKIIHFSDRKAAEDCLKLMK